MPGSTPSTIGGPYQRNAALRRPAVALGRDRRDGDDLDERLRLTVAARRPDDHRSEPSGRRTIAGQSVWNGRFPERCLRMRRCRARTASRGCGASHPSREHAAAAERREEALDDRDRVAILVHDAQEHGVARAVADRRCRTSPRAPRACREGDARDPPRVLRDQLGRRGLRRMPDPQVPVSIGIGELRAFDDQCGCSRPSWAQLEVEMPRRCSAASSGGRRPAC